MCGCQKEGAGQPLGRMLWEVSVLGRASGLDALTCCLALVQGSELVSAASSTQQPQRDLLPLCTKTAGGQL